jgi:iron complex outermembrane receptor protein
MATVLRLIRVLIAVSLMFVLAAEVAAQSSKSAQLTVTVTDTSGARVPDAAVILMRSNSEHTSTTNADGIATFQGLLTGPWTVEVVKQGFLTRQRRVAVQSAPTAVTIALEVGGVAENVLVQAAAPAEDALQLDAAATGGTRLDIPVRELPATLTVITQELIQERGINNATEATELAPGVTTFADSGSIPGINVRGFSSTSGAVSVLRDGIRQNTVPQSGRPLDTFMLDRIEVLKGPASLMAGEGAVGAAINYVSKEPRRELQGDTLLSYGSWDKYRIGLGISVPFTPTLAARFDVSHTDNGGWVDRTGDRMQSVLTAVRWMPTPSLSLKGSLVFTNDRIHPYYGTPLINNEVDERVRFINYNMRDERNEAKNNYGRIDAEMLLPHGWVVSNSLFAATQDVEWREYESVQYIPATGLVQVGSYFLAKRDDLLVGNQIDARKTFTLFTRPVDIVTGYLVQRNDQDRWTGGTIPNQNRTVDPFDPAPIFDPGFPFVFDRNVLVNTHTLFAEGRVGITDRLKFVAGARQERFQVDRSQVTTGFASKTYYPLTGRVGAVYMLTPLVSLYASHSRAVEPTTPLVSLTAASMSFSLQPSRQWEGGTKATLLGGRLETTFAWFGITKEDILTNTIVDGVRIQQQIGEQMSRGIEWSMTVTPTPSFVVMADATALNAEYVEFNENLGAGVVSRAGNDVPHNAAVVFNITPMQRIGPLSVSATLRKVGERWRDNANTIRLSPYTTLNASASVRFLRGTRLTVTGRNLTDEIYIPRSNSDVSGRIGAPRSFEVQLTRIF